MLKNKNAIITGAGSGIGRATVEVFAKNGANIWACVRKINRDFENELNLLTKQYNVPIHLAYCDLSDEISIKKCVRSVMKECSQIDILANIAGVVAPSSSFTMTSIGTMKKIFDVNFWGMTILTQYIVRFMMRQKHGSIINVSSIASLDGIPAQYEYASSKSAINGAVRQLSKELCPYGIRINAVAPGIINTNMSQNIPEGLREHVLSKIPMKRMGEPEEIANVIAFLGSDLSNYITGQIIRVDGGI